MLPSNLYICKSIEDSRGALVGTVAVGCVGLCIVGAISRK